MRNEEYNEKADIYSFGIMLYEMLTNKIPFEYMNLMQVLKAVAMNGQRPEIPESCPAMLKVSHMPCVWVVKCVHIS